MNGRADRADPQHYLLGVELGTVHIRVGVFTSQGRLLGSTKRTTKLERGADSVVHRMIQCVADAVDECDLSLNQLTAGGVGVPGEIDPGTGTVVSAPELKWKRVAPGPALRQALPIPIWIERTHSLAALGVYATELPRAPRRVAAIFCSRVTGGGLLRDGQFAGEKESRAFQERLGECHRQILALTGDSQVHLLQGKKLRQALRAGDGRTKKLMADIARLVAEVAGEVVSQTKPEVLVLGGSVIDEARAEFLPVFNEMCAASAAQRSTPFPEVFCSNLGDAACMVGAAFWAGQQLRSGAAV